MERKRLLVDTVALSFATRNCIGCRFRTRPKKSPVSAKLVCFAPWSQRTELDSHAQMINADYLEGGDLDPEYFSTQGAFNGSGIALASQSFQGDEQGSMVLYYQHYTGTIRFKQLRDGDWVGGTQSEIVAYDAKNGTPISAVAYALHNVSTVSDESSAVIKEY